MKEKKKRKPKTPCDDAWPGVWYKKQWKKKNTKKKFTVKNVKKKGS